MKPSLRNELIVGLAFVVAMVTLGAYTIVLGNLVFGATKLYLVDFQQIYGLKSGDPVRVEGHEVGEVKSIRLLPDGMVRAVLQVDAGVEIFREGGKVRVTPFSPLGGRVVEVTRGNPNATARGTYTAYKSGMSDQEAAAVVISGEAEGELLQTLNELVETNKDNVKKIVDNLALVSERLTKTDSVIGYLVNEPKGAEKLDAIATHLSSASGRIDRILERVEKGEGVIGGLVDERSRLTREVNDAVTAGRGALESADRILARADRGESALGVLVSDRDPKVKEDLTGIVGDVKVITGAIADEDSGGSLSKLLHDGQLYDGFAATGTNLASITRKVDDGHGLLGVLSEEQAGDDARATLRHLASITAAVDDPEAGALGLLVHDDALRGRVGRVVEEIERLVVEFRDSIEDVREQAPVNAFIGAVFAAF